MKREDLDDRLRDAWVDDEVPLRLRSRVMAKRNALPATGPRWRTRRLAFLTVAAAAIIFLALTITLRFSPQG